MAPINFDHQSQPHCIPLQVGSDKCMIVLDASFGREYGEFLLKLNRNDHLLGEFCGGKIFPVAGRRGIGVIDITLFECFPLSLEGNDHL